MYCFCMFEALTTVKVLRKKSHKTVIRTTKARLTAEHHENKIITYCYILIIKIYIYAHPGNLV